MKKNANQIKRRPHQVPRQDRPQGRRQPDRRDHHEQDLDHDCSSTEVDCLDFSGSLTPFSYDARPHVGQTAQPVTS